MFILFVSYDANLFASAIKQNTPAAFQLSLADIEKLVIENDDGDAFGTEQNNLINQVASSNAGASGSALLDRLRKLSSQNGDSNSNRSQGLRNRFSMARNNVGSNPEPPILQENKITYSGHSTPILSEKSIWASVIEVSKLRKANII
jgi:hypothetical protein